VVKVVRYDTDLAIDILRWYQARHIDAVVDAGFHSYSYPEYPYLVSDNIYICALCETELGGNTFQHLVLHETLEYEKTMERVKCMSKGCTECLSKSYLASRAVGILDLRQDAHDELLRSYPDYEKVLPEIKRVHTKHYQYYQKEAFG
jgi:hypothetical protein